MRKKLLLIFPLFAAACSGKLPEQEVLKIFSRHSYEEYSPQKISGLLKEKGAAGLAELDRHALVLKARRPVKARPSERNFSSGLLFGERRGGIFILKVFSDSPGAAAGFRDGDRVLALDGEAASPEAVRRLVEGGAFFRLKAERRGAAGPFEAGVPRNDFFFPPSFAFYDRDSRTAFLRLGLFFEGSSKAVLAGLDALYRVGAVNVIFDLRDNPGGVPAEAAEVLRAFAPKAGPVFEVRSRHKGYSALYGAAEKGRFAGMRQAAIVNSGTSKAAEVFARSLKELSGATLVGETMAGSVSLVRAFSLGDGRGLELSVARMFPPSGLDMEGKGAEPDIKAGAPGRVWDDSRETTLLGDQAYAAAAGLFDAGVRR
ncbi:MAG: S41 family peptidase [Elusimicrobiales bacterium]|nr:S41 family peptidase [Elusimicrobiales bacterium]